MSLNDNTCPLQVPGTYWDALNGNTKLGKAVRAACEELEHLNELVSGSVVAQCKLNDSSKGSPIS